MSERIILVTGSSGYLGQAICNELKNEGEVLVEFVGDITDSNNVSNNAKRIIDQYKRIDVIIHCASARIVRSPIFELNNDDFKKQFEVNVTGLFNIYKAFSSNISAGGLIIGISSASVYTEAGRSETNGSYLSAKYALGGLLRQISHELESRGIRVNIVAPAFMPGGLNSDMPEPVLELLLKKLNKNEVTSREYVAKVVVDLVSKPKEFPTSKVILVPTGEIKNL